VGFVDVVVAFVLPGTVTFCLDKAVGAVLEGFDGVGFVGAGLAGVGSATAGLVATVAYSKAPAKAAAVKVEIIFLTVDLPKRLNANLKHLKRGQNGNATNSGPVDHHPILRFGPVLASGRIRIFCLNSAVGARAYTRDGPRSIFAPQENCGQANFALNRRVVVYGRDWPRFAKAILPEIVRAQRLWSTHIGCERIPLLAINVSQA
jgi:hypothetical protein